jgi:hypothetical protein
MVMYAVIPALDAELGRTGQPARGQPELHSDTLPQK